MDKKNKDIKKPLAFAKTKPKFDFAFERINYIIMLIGLGLIAIGYILLVGGGSKDPDVFNYDLFNFRRLVLSPIFIVAGFVVEIYAILKKTKKSEE